MALRHHSERDPIESVGYHRLTSPRDSHRRIRQQLDGKYGAHSLIRSRRRKLILTLAALAASFLLYLVARPLLATSQADSPLLALVEDMRVPTSTEPVSATRSRGPAIDDELDKLLQPATQTYEGGEYGRSAIYWQQLYERERGQRRWLYAFYAGNAYRLDRNPDRTATLMEDLLPQLDPEESLYGMAALELGLALIELDRPREARTVLSGIRPVSRQSHRQAARLLKLL